MLLRNLGLSLIAMAALVLLAIGAAMADWSILLVIIPYAAFAVFLASQTLNGFDG